MGLDHRACIILKPVHGYVCDRDESQERESFHKGVTGRGEAGQGGGRQHRDGMIHRPPRSGFSPSSGDRKINLSELYMK